MNREGFVGFRIIDFVFKRFGEQLGDDAPPDEVSVACEVVMSVGHGIRLLDAAAVRRSRISQPTEGTSLLTFLHTNNERVKTDLQATLGTLALLAQPAPDGADQHWFAMDGAGGERGARWRLELDALDLPGSIERFRDTLDQVKENIREIERQMRWLRHRQ